MVSLTCIKYSEYWHTQRSIKIIIIYIVIIVTTVIIVIKIIIIKVKVVMASQ